MRAAHTCTISQRECPLPPPKTSVAERKSTHYFAVHSDYVHSLHLLRQHLSSFFTFLTQIVLYVSNGKASRKRSSQLTYIYPCTYANADFAYVPNGAMLHLQAIITLSVVRLEKMRQTTMSTVETWFI